MGISGGGVSASINIMEAEEILTSALEIKCKNIIIRKQQRAH